MNTDLIFQLISEVAKPLIIIVLLILVAPLIIKWIKNKKHPSAPTANLYYSELEKVIQRANNILDDPVLLKSELTATADNPRLEILESWNKVDAEFKRLAFEHCQVAPDNDPYPLDYVLFELEMKKKAGNTTLGFYRELHRLKDIILSLPDDEQIKPVHAAKYALLSGHVIKMLKEGPMPGIAGIF